MSGLNLDNILLEEEANISPFSQVEPEPKVIPKDPEDSLLEEINPNELFSHENNLPNFNEEKSVNNTKVSESTYSTFGAALLEEGIITASTQEDIEKIASGEDLIKLVEKEITARFDERTKRIDEALSVGLEPPIIKQYESVINYLQELDDTKITAESEDGEKLRAQLIMEDYLNKGFSKERAERETKKSIDSGNDIEDAKEALLEVRKHYKTMYTNAIEEKKAEVDKLKQKEIDSAKKVETMILKEKDLFPGIDLTPELRQKIADTAYKPIHTDTNGNKYSVIQKYQKENPEEFLAKLSTIFTLTDGFKDISKLVNAKVTQTTTKKLKELDLKLRGQNINNDISLRNNSGGELQTKTGQFTIDT